MADVPVFKSRKIKIRKKSEDAAENVTDTEKDKEQENGNMEEEKEEGKPKVEYHYKEIHILKPKDKENKEENENKSKEEKKSKSHKHKSKKRSRSKSKERSRRRSSSRSRSRSRSYDRKRSRYDSRDRSRSRDRKSKDRSRSRDRKTRGRSRSRDRKTKDRSRSRDRKSRDRSRSRDRKSRDRSRSRDRKSSKKSHKSKDYNSDSDASKSSKKSKKKHKKHKKHKSKDKHKDKEKGSNGLELAKKALLEIDSDDISSDENTEAQGSSWYNLPVDESEIERAIESRKLATLHGKLKSNREKKKEVDEDDFMQQILEANLMDEKSSAATEKDPVKTTRDEDAEKLAPTGKENSDSQKETDTTESKINSQPHGDPKTDSNASKPETNIKVKITPKKLSLSDVFGEEEEEKPKLSLPKLDDKVDDKISAVPTMVPPPPALKMPAIPTMVPPPSGLKAAAVPAPVPPPTTDVDSKKGLGLKLGIKISAISAELISSGVKVENDPKKKNLEDGEISGSEDEKKDSGGSGSEEGSGSRRKKKKKKDRKRSRSKDRSKSPSRKRRHSRSRSRSKGRSGYDRKTGVWRSRSRSRERRRSRSRDRRRRRSRDRFYGSYYRERGRSRSRSRDRHRRRRRSSSGSRRKSSRSPEDLRLKIDKAKLREIAMKNAYLNMSKGVGPKVELKPEVLAAMKAGGKSVEELTQICKSMQKKPGDISDSDSSGDYRPNSDDEDVPFMHHPFQVKEAGPIALNIRNARPLPALSAEERAMKAGVLRTTFPVSSGSHHRVKELEWVPVEKDKQAATTPAPTPAATPAPTDSGSSMPALPAPAAPAEATPTQTPNDVFPEEAFNTQPVMPVNIGAIVSERLSAMKKLQNNPNDPKAKRSFEKTEKGMQQWAQSKNLPGQFTGSTGANILDPKSLQGGNPGWVRKDYFHNTRPVTGGVGMFLLQKMGWRHGQGLGRNNDGATEPLKLDFKVDRKGLSGTGEVHHKVKTQPAVYRDLSGKHPVSALVELCNKKKWGPPDFIVVHESGPDHKKNFLYKVKVNNTEYKPSVASQNKKLAKAQAASVCLQELGLIPR